MTTKKQLEALKKARAAKAKKVTTKKKTTTKRTSKLNGTVKKEAAWWELLSASGKETLKKHRYTDSWLHLQGNYAIIQDKRSGKFIGETKLDKR